MRILEHLAQIVDRSARHVHGLQRLQPVLARAGAQRRLHGFTHGLSVPDPRDVGAVALVPRHRFDAGDLAETTELPIVADRQDHRPVGRLEHLVRHDVRMAVGKPLRDLCTGEVIGARVHQPGDLAVQQRNVDLLPFSGRVAMAQRRQDADRRVHARHDVGDADAHLHRRAVGLAGQAHDAAHALDQEVIACAPGVGAGLAEAGDRAIHQAGIALAQAGIVQSMPGQSADLVVFHQHIGPGQQAVQQRAPVLGGDVDGDRALVAIGAEVVGALVRVAAILADNVGRPPFARIIALPGLLHLDHVRAQIAQQLGGAGTGQNARKVKNAHAVERAGDHRLHACLHD
ncbi:Uncharacterised protein [Achromobacter xylosoxidans]|nr:Uncharacterised protein [Achromobacter xylosoxidans]